MVNVFNISGGRSSALMTILEYQPGDIVLFTDTGREMPQTYDFLNNFEKIEGIPIIRLNHLGYFSEMVKQQKMIPNRVARFCTKILKIECARKYLLSIGVKQCNNHLGFRYDEQERILKSRSRWVGYKQKFILNELKIDKQQVINYWKHKKYDLGIPHILGNCDLCFLKGKNAIIRILISHPELAKKWIDDEKLIGKTYIKGVSYSQLLDVAKNNLFKDIELDNIEYSYNCSCNY
jgi:hypothetical protein